MIPDNRSTPTLIERSLRPFERFVQIESAGGILLLGASLVAGVIGAVILQATSPVGGRDEGNILARG